MTAHTRPSHSSVGNDGSASDLTVIIDALWTEVESLQAQINALAPSPPPPSGTPPTPVLVVAPSATGYVTHTVIAQGFGTTPGNSAITAYSFDWGDDTSVSSSSRSFASGAATYSVPVPIAHHRYTAAGTYTLTMAVTDANGNRVTQTRTITVNALPATTVTVNPGDNVMVALNGAAANAVIQINAGSYTATAQWIPKSGQIVWANGAVTITGNNTIQEFYAGDQQNAVGVVIQGIRFTAFKTFAFQTAGSLTATFILKDCEIDTCGTTGVVSGGVNAYHAFSIVLDHCHIHNNVAYNVAGSQGAFVYIIGGEYDHGFTDTSGAINPNAGDGSFKLVHAPASYVVGANIHDNQGVGLWWDGSNVNVYACLNTFTNNYGPGLFWEINDAALGGDANNIAGNLDGSGYSLRVLFNTFTGNGNDHPPWFPIGDAYPAQLWVAKSDKIEVAYNWFDGGGHILMLDYQGSRPAGHNLANIAVHDNDIRFRETTPNDDRGIGRIGFLDQLSSAAYSLVNVTFTYNHYFGDHDDANWLHFSTYAGTTRTSKTFAQWKAAGYDAAATWAARAAWPH